MSLSFNKHFFFHVLLYIKRHFACLKFNITHLIESVQDFHEVLLMTFNILAAHVHLISLFISHDVGHFDETDFVKHSGVKGVSDEIFHVLIFRLSSSGEFHQGHEFLT